MVRDRFFAKEEDNSSVAMKTILYWFLLPLVILLQRHNPLVIHRNKFHILMNNLKVYPKKYNLTISENKFRSLKCPIYRKDLQSLSNHLYGKKFQLRLRKPGLRQDLMFRQRRRPQS